ncbi:hypothetical protein RHOFW104T7_12640 [Rhodanobacter thiooxydans]|uniref:Serine/threonine protein kinase n=1 Tax=Rhodanobacter thiooxydans TaxID=416169 RepID=A0A154QHH8_9GAMM|nr:hypothetical protein [Rhodanobacter thiooxydans]KZC23588.1 hypothetical protein RHOFW104T7_12640 [Rhodanobacter thiooxydans]MCW0201066.1 hypothetical protein [Rhodanobacter thiooxydans]
MELDEMKLAWQALGQQLERQNMLNLELLRQKHASRLRHHLRPLVWGQSLQIVFGVAAMLWGIAFWSTHQDVWQAMACGIAMQVFGTLALVFPTRLLAMQQGIDYAAPVLDIQHRLARMRAWRVKVEAPVFVVLGSVIWIPAMLMLFQYDFDRVGAPQWWGRMPGLPLWMLLCGVVSLGFVGLVYGVLRWLGHRRWLEDNLAGSAIRKAETALDEIVRFERE